MSTLGDDRLIFRLSGKGVQGQRVALANVDLRSSCEGLDLRSTKTLPLFDPLEMPRKKALRSV